MSKSQEAQAAADVLAAAAANDTPKTPEQLTEEAATASAAAAAKAAEDAFEGLPPEYAWMGNELKGLRKEAGGYRTQLRAQEELFKTAVTADDHEAAVNANRKFILELTLKDALREHDLPETAAALIQGATPEDTYARAAALAAVVGNKPAPAVAPTPLQVDQLHASYGAQGGPPKPLTGAETYRSRHKRK